MFSLPAIFQNRRHKNRRRFAIGRRRGTTLIEAALCMTFVLLPVTLGGFQMAMVFITSHSLQQIARESARWSAVHYNDVNFNDSVDQGSKPGQLPSLLYFMRGQSVANGIAWTDINGSVSGGSVVVTPASTLRSSGTPMTITITYPMRKRSFLGSLFFKSDDGQKLNTIQLGFLKSNWVEASTTLLE